MSLMNGKCVSAACSIHDFILIKTATFFVVKKLGEEVIDIGREFSDFGTLVKVNIP